MVFVNRTTELAALERWWDATDTSLCLVWGRRRVGKTALLQQFGVGRRCIFHTGGGRPEADELAGLSRQAGEHDHTKLRDLAQRPFTSWDDALEWLHARQRLCLDASQIWASRSAPAKGSRMPRE